MLIHDIEVDIVFGNGLYLYGERFSAVDGWLCFGLAARPNLVVRS